MSETSQTPWSVSSLHIYPIKSCAGIDLTAVRFDPRGPLYDRMFMVVDEAGDFLSQRKLPRMSLITPRLGAMALGVSAPDMPPLKLAMTAPPDSKRVAVRLRSAQLEVEDVGEQAASWFSQFLQHRCRLVRMASDTVRFADAQYGGSGIELAFPDGFPALLVSQASLADLNSRLSDKVTVQRFRPNIVVRGPQAYAEDGWREVRIGAVAFDVVKPCSRCSIITIDPARGQLQGPEPLATLAKYRAADGKAFFGQNLVHRALGSIRVGEAVTVQIEGDRRPAVA